MLAGEKLSGNVLTQRKVTQGALSIFAVVTYFRLVPVRHRNVL